MCVRVCACVRGRVRACWTSFKSIAPTGKCKHNHTIKAPSQLTSGAPNSTYWQAANGDPSHILLTSGAPNFTYWQAAIGDPSHILLTRGPQFYLLTSCHRWSITHSFNKWSPQFYLLTSCHRWSITHTFNKWSPNSTHWQAANGDHTFEHLRSSNTDDNQDR